MPDRKPTRIERLAPEITALADELGDEVFYHGGDYFLRHMQRSLWNTRELGALTPERAKRAASRLRDLVDDTAQMRAMPKIDRAMRVIEKLRTLPWSPPTTVVQVSTEVDRGSLDRWMGKYSLAVCVGTARIEVRDVVRKDDAFAELERRCREAFVTP